MRDLRIGLAQINPTVGDIRGNLDKIVNSALEAQKFGTDVLILPEMALSGYPPEDLLIKNHFVEDCEEALAALPERLPREMVVLVGSPTRGNSKPFNSASVIAEGREVGRYHKMLLPNYGVFDENRVLQAGKEPVILEMAGARLGIHICEDSWFTDRKPAMSLQNQGLDAVLNLSSSPFHLGKYALRERVFGALANLLQCHVLCCNLAGGQDELVFDGSSKVLSPAGKVVHRAASFEEDLLLFDLPISQHARSGLGVGTVIPIEPYHREKPRPELPPPPRVELLPELEEVYGALKLGLSDYFTKNGFKGALIAISGGIDSALVASLAVDALGKDAVTGLTLPSRYSSSGTLTDAGSLTLNMGIPMDEIPIQPLFEHYLETLTPLWPGRDPDATEENLQARIRGNIVMALSNKFGLLVLTTGNKSEMATGYCTLYGDMAGGFALIKDVPKTMVFELCRWRNQQNGSQPWIPESIITRPPSAELREEQKDSDSLPPYNILDPILERYVEQDQSLDEIVGAGFDPDTVKRIVRLVDFNEYKRRQGAPGVKITPKAFGRDRRLPITNSYRETLEHPSQ